MNEIGRRRSVPRGRALAAAPLAILFCVAVSSAQAANISGTVFEDVNYGGGAGRSQGASGGVTLQNVRVELYNAVGGFVNSTTTNGSGSYSFNGLLAGSYTVRVVNASVPSSRAGYVAGLLPVQTYRTNASSGSAVTVTNYVGGQDPTVADAGNGGAGTTMNTATGVFTAGIAGTAQSFTAVTLVANVTGVDFGFNFNTIVNTNDTGQGSLRQFLINSDTLGNAGLSIVGQTAGKDVSIFMISDSLAHPGLRAGIANQLTAGVALILPASNLPSITASDTTLDGTTQTTDVGNTNAAVLGVGGTVGVDALVLGQVAGPEVELRNTGVLASGVRIQANSATVRGLAIHGFGTVDGEAGIRVDPNFTGFLIEDNVLGSSALSWSDPGAATRNWSGIYLDGADNGTIRDNLIGFSKQKGVHITNTATGFVVDGNEIRDNGLVTTDGDGIAISTTSTGSCTGNLITGASSQGYIVVASAGNVATNNTIVGNGVGIPSGVSQSQGVTMRPGTTATLLDRNVIRANYGAGLAVNSGASGTRLTRNSFQSNGTIVARNGGAATGQIGIDLNSAADDGNLGTSPFFTLNDSGDGDAGGNALLNYPILTSASIAAGNLTLDGFARPGSVIELYVSDGDPTGFGEGQTWKLTLTEGGTGAGGNDPYADTDGGTGSYGPGAINGLAQGSDTTNRFLFTFPVPSGVVGGTKLTATATLGSDTSEFSGVVTVVVASADLSLTKNDNPDPAPAGGELLYTLLVTNNGPNNATSVVVTDNLPAGVALVSATPTQGSCSGTGPVTCNLGGILNSGTASIEILVVTGSAGSITNNASVGAAENDPVAGNNAASAVTTVVNGGTTDIPLTLYRRIHGFLDYNVTGGTLRTQPNTGNPCLVGASGTALLSGIPATATVVGAYLYWAGSGSTIDNQVTLDASPLTADRTWSARYVLGAQNYDYFGGFEDVTAYVQAKRNGNYTFGGLSVDTGNPYCSLQAVLAGWALIAIYEDNSLTGKTLVLYDGFDLTRNGSSSYVLSGIFASPPPQGKATTLVWEGDESLGGATESLVFNGVSLSDALDPVNNVYNSTVNSLGSSTAYGVDLDTFDVSSTIAARDTSATLAVNTGPDLVILNAVLLEVKSNIIVGTVFEDVNYGGGAGRDLATAVASAPTFSVPRPGAVVELYDGAGGFIRSTTTSATGDYGFAGLVDGNYTVRVVNESVGSSRAGALATLRPVQTFRTNGSSGAAVATTDEVGGASPKDVDAPANTTSANLSSFIAQSKAPARIITGIAILNADFGYNFDTVVNTSDAGQGSLRQFVANASALGSDAALAQSGSRQSAGVSQPLPAAKETSIFMISDSLAHPGLRAGLPNLLTGGVAVVPSSTGPLTLAGANAPNTILDGTTQTANVGNTNAGVLGVGGTVGVDGLTLPQLQRPEVEIRDASALARGVELQAANDGLRGLAVWGFGNAPGGTDANVWIDGSGALVEQCVLGTSATGFTDPGAATRSRGVGVGSTAASAVTVQDCLIGFSADAGISALGALSGWLVQRNEIRGNGIGGTSLDGLTLGNGISGSTARQNLLVANEACGIDLHQAGGTITLQNNTVVGNGVSASGTAETPGIRVAGAGNTIDRNVLHDNFGGGAMVESSSGTNRFTRNSMYDNGEVLNLGGAGPTGQLGIDLLSGADSATRGSSPFFTLNDAGDADAGGNALLNYPILTSAALIGSTLHVSGFARPGSTVEIFLANPDPSGFGEGETFVFSGAEGSGADTDAGSGSYGPGAINGIVQGTDTTNRFSFQFVPAVPVATGQILTATATDAAGNTSEYSGNVTVVHLSVVKKAFLTDGTPIGDASVLPRGTQVRFLLYVNNLGGAVSDVTLRDLLDPTFAYVAGSIRTSNTLARCADSSCTPAEEAAILAAANAGSVGTDALDADRVSFSGGSVHAGNQNVANAQLDIVAARVFALVFTVRMQ